MSVLEFIDNIFDYLCCSAHNNAIKIKVKIHQNGTLDKLLIKYPAMNRYTVANEEEFIREILRTWFKKDGNDYYPKRYLYETLSDYYGNDPEWYELNTEWIKFSYTNISKICGYRKFKIDRS